jgi:subtilisin-like proprotein convertase family protein/sugar lactone lactonase YvrE
MKIRSSVFVLLCLVALLAAWRLWPRGPASSARVAENNSSALAGQTSSSPAVAATDAVAPESTGKNSAATTNRLAYRLSNVPNANLPAVYAALTRAPHAVLLENALVDTDAKIDFTIPKHLQTQGDPGAYIVQARGQVDPAFRSLLTASGAQEISYIPNNALLVRLTADTANSLKANPLVQAVLPYEPYYKVQATLLGAAVAQKPLYIGQMLTLGLFADTAAATVAAIEKMGGVVVARDRSPFGPVVRIHPPQDWVALAQLPGVQRLEPTHQRKAANDLSRVILGVSANTTTTTNYLNLSGSNVVVEVNDTGIDATHPDLLQSGGVAPSRVTGFFLDSTIDIDGHGTHVAGIIAGNGFESTTVTNARGSLNPGTNTQYRGKAPLAKLVSLGFLGANNTNFPVGDSELQEAPALTNALISCNAWVNDGANEYDLSAASYDAAVRDALPGITGPQPALFVFAAGNEGAGDTSGQNGNADSIASPGTGKNVVTVGALEQFRNITNDVRSLDGTTNKIWVPRTDSSSQVADYSARGNVGVFTEGAYGRFKPDVIAPGTFVVSTRSTTWDTNAYYNVTNFHTATYRGLVVRTNTLLFGLLAIPINTIAVKITVTPNAQSPTPFPNFPIYVSATAVPTPTMFDLQKNNAVSIPPDSGGAIADVSSIANGQIEFAIGNGTNFPASFDLTTQVITTNDLGNQLEVEQYLNDHLGTGNPNYYYRYETGTSMAAAAVSGTLALMQDFFTNTLALTPSPALLKAMLINGARVAGSYKFAVTNTINLQGWGLVKLTNSIPSALTNTLAANTNKPLFFVDQSPTNTVKTGDRRTYLVTVPTPAARAQALRITLAWTDPPGNPAAGIKLVNDLDLVVTNLNTGTVYFGNNFSSSANPPNTLPAATNGTAFTDNINNIENIYLSPSLGTNYSITVVGTAVNVNAVTLEQTNVVQDFVLVVSSGDGNNTNGIAFTPGTPSFATSVGPVINYLPATNGILFNQYAGANAPWLSTNTIAVTNAAYGFAGNARLSIGVTNQWHFFVITNTFAVTNPNFTNAAFVTFLPQTLAIPREGGYVTTAQNPTRPAADLELFVASSPDALAAQLLNIDRRVISNCLAGVAGDGASIGRGGEEFVVFDNSTANQIYYVAIQCQDQLAGQYAFASIFSDTPFGSLNPDGSQNVYGKLVPAVIPDGDNAHPGNSYSLGIALYPMTIRRVTVANTVSHQNFGDLVGGLTHEQQYSILNNHNGIGFVNPLVRVYDDSGEGPTNNVFHTDAPGTLKNFNTKEAVGIWLLNEVDDNRTQTGRVENFTVRIYPHKDLTTTYGSTNLITVTLPPLSWYYDYIYVPGGYTNLLLLASNLPPTSVPPIQLYLNDGDVQPDFNTFLLRTELTNGIPPGNSLSYGPPLAPGFYQVGLYNPDPVNAHDVLLGAILSYNASAAFTVDYFASGPVPLLDDAITTDSILVTNTQAIQKFNVGLRVDHPRISDLVFHLISPSGTRYLLMENRGGQDTNGCGFSVITTNYVNVNANGGSAAQTNYLDTHQVAGTIPVNYQMFGIPDQMTIYYSTNPVPANLITNIFVSGPGQLTITYPPPSAVGSSTFLTIVMNATNHPPSTRWTYNVGGVATNNFYLTFTEDESLTNNGATKLTPIKFAPPPFVPSTNVSIVWTDSFEAYPLGTNLALGGWTRLATNSVIATNPPAYDGTNFLTLPNGGAISTNLTTVPGLKYQLTYQLGGLPYEVFYTANNFDNTVQRFDTNGIPITFVGGLNAPSAVAVDGSGNVFVALQFDNTIERYTPNGQHTTFVNAGAGLSSPLGLTFDGAGNLYVANLATGLNDGFVVKISPAGVQTLVATNLNVPIGLAFDSAGNLYVSEYANDDILKITPAGVVSTFTTFPANSNPWGIALAPNGNLYVALNSTPDVQVVPPSGIAAPFATGFSSPLALAFDTRTNLYVTDASQTIFQISPTGAATNFTAVGATGGGPFGLAYYNSSPDGANSLNWQAQATAFTASLPATPLVLDAGSGSFLTADVMIKNSFDFNATFDAFVLTQLPSDLYYQPEQSLADIPGTSANGTWQLEVLDNRAGPGLTNNARLVDWRLEFVLARTNLAPAALGTFNAATNGAPINSTLVAGGGYFGYYTVVVPGGALVATNALLSASLPVNVWFTTNNPATAASASGTLLFAGVNGATKVLDTTTTSPLISGGQTYYLLIENTNATPVSFTVRVDFDSTSPSAPLRFSAAKLGTTGKPQLQWLNTRGIGYKVQWSDTIAPPVWHTINKPTVITTNRVSTFIDNGSQTAPLGPQRYYRLLRVP